MAMTDPTVSLSDCRKAFEAEMQRIGQPLYRQASSEGIEYGSEGAKVGWIAWQAAWDARTPVTHVASKSLVPISLSEPAARVVRNKPLFVPLKTEYYEAFERGDKTTELRIHGPRWNEQTCYIGREVTLSKGYGKKHRLEGIIVGVETRAANDLHEDHDALMACYGGLDYRVIIIHIQTPPLRLL